MIRFQQLLEVQLTQNRLLFCRSTPLTSGRSLLISSPDIYDSEMCLQNHLKVWSFLNTFVFPGQSSLSLHPYGRTLNIFLGN